MGYTFYGRPSCKKILVEAAESEEKKMKSIAQRTIGVIFFSVPHKGSDLVNLFKTVPYILKPSIDIEHLQKGSAKLLTLHERFKDFVHQNNIAILSFGETKKSRWGLTLSMLVTEDSSDPDFGEFYPLPMDHLSTCKPESQTPRYIKGQYNFKKLHSIIFRFVKKIFKVGIRDFKYSVFNSLKTKKFMRIIHLRFIVM
ncbi:protein SERAC1 [Caerostris extrusa]|uniref:Protein SERAC1 n=1 Tax=Caerostris extrusa TaxID=172846 RepID=A0AAV4W9S8_CAEEX|nr:protein SERAC1 [Caerostris extrusa]